ncbi:hypothetical protein [Paenibacillus sp. JCM 10914]|uniref:hypothetical protein n=1 Tax=Paenibacillus sp. JCM 10914 TaxID=1236974 RepID=UPI0003CC74E1|nr:hypothetical protein [Paenibacillus sp. JCM 10914]GAE07515.1 hypothetical protein JCM10914_3747 [Paenibacillus sp. JCM 10914]
MRTKWPALLLVVTLGTGLLTIGKTNEAQANVNEQQVSNANVTEDLSLGTDGRSRLYPKAWYPGYQDDQGRFLHDFAYAGYHRGEKELPKFKKHEGINVTKSPYKADPTGRTDSTLAIQKAIDDASARWGSRILTEGNLSGNAAERQGFFTEHRFQPRGP